MNIFLTKLVKFIGMTVIPEHIVGQKNPHSFPFKPDSKPVEDHGVSGTVILVESHIAAHSWVDNKFLNVAITSCKEYKDKMTALWVVGYCKSKTYEFGSVKF